MCDVCHAVIGHNIGCPETPYDEDDYNKICPICEREYDDEDEMLWGVCMDCIEKNATFATVYEYGAKRPNTVTMNALWVKFFSPEQIDEIIKQHAYETIKFFPDLAKRYALETVSDDWHDFADWLKEKKG